MRKITVFIFIYVFFVNLSDAQLLKFDFNTSPYINATIVNSKVTCSSMELSTGIIDVNQTTGDYFTDEPYISESGGWAETTIAAAKHFYINITAQPGQKFSIANLNLQAYASGSGPSAISVLFNDTEVFTNNMEDSKLLSINKQITGYSNLTSLNIKITGWDNGSRSTSGGGIFRIDNLILSEPNDSTSSISFSPSNIPAVISSTVDSIKILEFTLTDSASGDGVNTLIDSICFVAATNNQITNWKNAIDSIKLKTNETNINAPTLIKNDSIIFSTKGLISIEEGTSNAQTFELWFWLNDSLPDMDNKQFELYTDSTLIHCNTAGSIINFGKIETGTDKLIIDVTATKIQGELSNSIIRVDSVFGINVSAVDLFGNVDIDYTETAYLNHESNTGTLNSPNGSQINFANGTANFKNLSVDKTDTISVEINSGTLQSFNIQKLLVSKHIFADNFEQNTLNNWTNTNDWTITNNVVISGNSSLKHNLSDSSATSFITSTYNAAGFNYGSSVWRLALRNGNFDPTSSNKFWYYLMASADSLIQDSVFGYAIGVNFSGSTDSISLWRIDNDGYKIMLLQSRFEWEPDTTAFIEVIREVTGIWRIGTTTNSDYNNIQYTNTASDNTYSNLTYHGLVFSFSSSRAGLLWMDDLDFFQMNTPPVLLSASASGNNKVLVQFSEPVNPLLATDINNYALASLNDDNISIDSILINTEKQDRVEIYVNRLKTAEYNLTINNISDPDGSVMLKQTLDFSYAVPAKTFDVIINEIMADPKPQHNLPIAEFIELYNANNNTFDMENWSIVVGTKSKTISGVKIEPHSYLLLCETDFLNEYPESENTMELLSSGILTNSGTSILLKNEKGEIIDSVFYSENWYKNEIKEDGGWSLERIDPLNTCSTSSNWTASKNASGGTPGYKNSVMADNIDLTAPLILNHKIKNSNIIQICFSEPLSTTLFQNPTLFTFENDTCKIDSILWDYEHSNTYNLYINKALTSATTYTLKCKNIADECGNIISDTALTIFYYEAQAHDIVFTEIMADEKPANGLPETRYLELYNRSIYEINLNEWTIEYENIKKEFPEALIQPGEYVIVCQSGHSGEFETFGQAIDILSSTSISSKGKLLQLYDNSNKLINSIHYSDNWYNNPDKEDGGWSLERIDNNNLCSEKSNWTASENSLGGTPGSINSVNAINNDNLAPFVIYIETKNDSLIEIQFSEELDTTLTSADNFNIKNHSITKILFSPDNRSVCSIIINDALQYNSKTSIEFIDIKDLCGNTFSGSNVFEYNKIEKNDIIISELFVDPSPSIGLPEHEFIEIVNLSNKTINLQNLTISLNELQKTLPKHYINPNEYLILCSSSAYSELSEFGTTIEVIGFPSLTNSGATLTLSDTAKKVINEVTYSDTWYRDEEKSEGGWSLEIIDPTNQCNKTDNWKASNSPFGGTPGNKNSINKPNPDNSEPYILMALPSGNSKVLLQFSEPIPETNLNQLVNYSIKVNKTNITRTIDSVFNNGLVIGIDQQLQQKDDIEITVRNIKDFCDNSMPDTTINISYYAPRFYDIVINEIMADPEPSVGLPNTEYIEIYNKSDYNLHLYNWQIGVGNTKRTIPYFEFKAKSYVIICDSDNHQQLESYGQVISIDNLPNLSQNGTLQVCNQDEKTICITNYYSSWITDDFKSNGGFSLERIDYNNPTEEIGNWQVSLNSQGGTPGKINSVFTNNADNTEFNLTRAFPIDNNLLILQFNKAIDSYQSIQNIFTINDESIADYYLIEPYNNAFGVKFEQDLKPTVIYSVIVNNELTDLSGNQLKNNTDDFMVPEKCQPNDLLFNEVMFESLDESIEFVELYNNSNSAINLNELNIATRNSNGELKNVYPILQDIILSGEYKVISMNKNLITDYYNVENEFAFLNSPLPSLSNSEGTIVLLDTLGTIIDEFSYHQDMHFGLLENSKGISLERINFNLPTQDKNNWLSAAEAAGWATPGYQNSVFKQSFNETNSTITIDPETFSPDNDGYNDLLNIHYNFNESGLVANVQIINKNGYKIRQLTNNELIASNGYFVWDGLTDDNEKAPIGIYIIFIEVFNDEGKVWHYKETCVVATKF